MYATLSFPAHWPCKLDQNILNKLGGQIAYGLRISLPHLAGLPVRIPISVERIGNEELADLREPELLVVVTITDHSNLSHGMRISESSHQLAVALGNSCLWDFAPDCVIRLRVVAEHAVPIGG